jgi:hypothetical protein
MKYGFVGHILEVSGVAMAEPTDSTVASICTVLARSRILKEPNTKGALGHLSRSQEDQQHSSQIYLITALGYRIF